MSNLNFSMYNIQTPTSVTNGNYGKLTVAGPGTTVPSGPLSVTPPQYSIGTASQASNTITGVGTTFTAAMVGSQFVFANGVSAGTINARSSNTSLTVSISQTVASGGFSIYYTGLQVSTTGKVGINNTQPLYHLDSIGNIAVSRFGAGNTPVFAGQSAGGTQAIPTAVSNSTYLVTLGGRGYNGTSFTTATSPMYISGKTTEDWTPTATGTSILFATTPNTTTATAEVMIITNAGNVGIGTLTPAYQLQLSTDSAGKPGVGGLWTITSDERIKKDIELADLDRCYDIVKNVPLKRFGWADGVYTEQQVKDQHNLGWIAQDVQKVFPKAVSVKPFTKHLETGAEVIEDCLDLNSGQLIMALYGAVQKLQAKVEALELKVVVVPEVIPDVVIESEVVPDVVIEPEVIPDVVIESEVIEPDVVIEPEVIPDVVVVPEVIPDVVIESEVIPDVVVVPEVIPEVVVVPEVIPEVVVVPEVIPDVVVVPEVIPDVVVVPEVVMPDTVVPEVIPDVVIVPEVIPDVVVVSDTVVPEVISDVVIEPEVVVVPEVIEPEVIPVVVVVPEVIPDVVLEPEVIPDVVIEPDTVIEP